MIGTCKLSDASNLATNHPCAAGDTSRESELVGIMQSYTRARNAPIEEGKILPYCQSAIALWHRARHASFTAELLWYNCTSRSTELIRRPQIGVATGFRDTRTEPERTLTPSMTRTNRTSRRTSSTNGPLNEKDPAGGRDRRIHKWFHVSPLERIRHSLLPAAACVHR